MCAQNAVPCMWDDDSQISGNQRLGLPTPTAGFLKFLSSQVIR